MKKIIYLILFVGLMNPPYIISQLSITITEVSPSSRTIYDLQSNGSSHLLQQDPSNSPYIHATYMYSPNSDSLVSSRRTVYFFSSDFGYTWNEYGSIIGNIRSGFPVMLVISDGSALIGNHSSFGGGTERAQWFADVAPGAGTFTRLDPGTFGSSAVLWPIGIQTNSIINQTKFVFVAGNNRNRGLSLSSSNFSGYVPEPDISTSFRCAFAKSSSGKIGLAYIMESITVRGRVSFKESTDDGVTWSTPVLIWNPAVNSGYGAYNGIDVGYNGNTPNVVFETVKYVSNQPDINSTARINFWSPNVNSGIPVVLDSSNDMRGLNPQSDGYAPVCRPVIGYIGNYPVTVVAYEKTRTDTSSAGNNYFDVWYRYSTDFGSNWGIYNKITNLAGPLKDYRYVSISDKNDAYSNNHYINLLFQMDSVAGSNVNGLDRSLARMFFCRIRHTYFVFPGITNINSNIPNSFLLKQNYPNPFNPKTFIDFDIPKESDVKLTIYNSLGEITDILVDQSLKAGSYRVDWDANKFASGVYFYSINAGEFYESKKMIFLK